MKGCPKGRSWVQKGDKSPVPRLLKTKQIVAKNAKLTLEDVNAIRHGRFNERRTLESLASWKRVAVSTIQQICSGKTWQVRQK